MELIKCDKCACDVPPGKFCDQCGTLLSGVADNKESLPSITLIQVEGGNARLVLKPDTVIGRTHGNYVDTLKNFKFISGKHAYITFSESNGWAITDLGSTNGTYVNDDRLNKDIPHSFKKGDIIDLGTMIFEVI